jgi:hypothetical protein
MFKDDNIQDRIYRNWLVIISAFYTIEKNIQLPFGFEKLMQLTYKLVKRQNKETEKGDEVSTFWNIVQYLVAEGHLREEVDFRLEIGLKLETDKGKYVWEEPTRMLYLNHNRVFMLYRKHGTQSRENVLPVKSLEFYLKNHNAYLGKKSAVAFKAIDPASGNVFVDQDMGTNKRMITTAYCFRYDNLHVDITNTQQVSENDLFADIKPLTERYEKEKAPF